MGILNQTLPEPGHYLDMSNAEYHGLRLVPGKSALAHMEKAELAYKALVLDPLEDDNEEKSTTALSLGISVHIALEGTFDDMIAVGPNVKSRNEKKWKEFEEKYPDKICLKPNEAMKVQDMAAAVLSHEPTRPILESEGYRESTFIWRDPKTGLLCKCRPDFVTKDFRIVIDYKTAQNADHYRFQRSAFDHHYYASAAITLDGIEAVTGIRPERYIYLVVESSFPYLVASYDASNEEIAEGRKFFERNLGRVKTCLETGVWRGLSEETRPLGLPAWAKQSGKRAGPEGLDPEILWGTA